MHACLSIPRGRTDGPQFGCTGGQTGSRWAQFYWQAGGLEEAGGQRRALACAREHAPRRQVPQRYAADCRRIVGHLVHHDDSDGPHEVASSGGRTEVAMAS